MLTDRQADPVQRSPLNLLPRLFARHFAEGIVTKAETIAPRWRAIRIYCPEMARLNYAPGQHVRIELRDPFSVYGILRPIETMRTYTIWNWDAQELCFDLHAHLYDGDGIGLNWARNVQAGNGVRFWGPQGDLLPKPAAFHLFVGDETALPAFGPLMQAAARIGEQVGIFEVDTSQECLPLPETATVLWLVREGGSPIASRRLLEAVCEADLPASDAVAYVAGEARSCQMVRDHLVSQRGWARSAVQVKPFWAAGKRGLH